MIASEMTLKTAQGVEFRFVYRRYTATVKA
jgi:hypothetical protein